MCLQWEILHLNLIKSKMPAYRWRIMSSKTKGEGSHVWSSHVARQPRPFISDKKKKKSPLRFNNRVVCIKMQSRLPGCIWRTAKISRGNFQTYRWMADLRLWVPVKTNTQAPQITQNKLPGYGFEKLNGQNCTICTQCVFLFYWAVQLQSHFVILKPLQISIWISCWGKSTAWEGRIFLKGKSKTLWWIFL